MAATTVVGCSGAPWERVMYGTEKDLGVVREPRALPRLPRAIVGDTDRVMETQVRVIETQRE